MALLPTDPKQQRVVMIGMLGLVLAAGFYFFRYSKQVVVMEEKEANVQTLTDVLDGLTATLKRNGGNLGPRIAILEQHAARMEQLIPMKQDVPRLLEAIAQEAVNADVTWGGITPQPMEATAYYTREVYDVVVSGAYHDIGSYLSGIASLPRIIKAKDMKITVDHNAKPRSDGLPTLRASFAIETYVVPLPSETAPGDTAKAGI